MKKLIRSISRYLFKLPFYIVIYPFLLLRIKLFFKIDQIRSLNLMNKNILILGNGPSLSQKKIQREIEESRLDVMAVNDFCLTSLFTQLKPKYYIIADPSYWSNKVDSNTKLFRKKLFSKMGSETSWNLNLFTPLESKKYILSNVDISSNKFINVIFYNLKNIDCPDFYKNFLYDRAIAMPIVQNVLVVAIFHSMLMGYKSIEIYGAEHSWLKDLYIGSDNKVMLKSKHFYSNEESVGKEWLKYDGEPYKLHEILSDLSKMFASYQDLQRYSKFKGVNIVNCTEGSFIDAFDRRLN